MIRAGKHNPFSNSLGDRLNMMVQRERVAPRRMARHGIWTDSIAIRQFESGEDGGLRDKWQDGAC